VLPSSPGFRRPTTSPATKGTNQEDCDYASPDTPFQEFLLTAAQGRPRNFKSYGTGAFRNGWQNKDGSNWIFILAVFFWFLLCLRSFFHFCQDYPSGDVRIELRSLILGNGWLGGRRFFHGGRIVYKNISIVTLMPKSPIHAALLLGIPGACWPFSVFYPGALLA